MANSINGLDREYIFFMWPGDDQIPMDRVAEIISILSNSRCAGVFVDHRNYHKWELPEAPFHPALPYLSQTNKSDYLRIYLMHHYGGGYTDVKFTYKPWDQAFETLRNSEAMALGYPISSASQVAMNPNFENTAELALYKEHYHRFIGHVAFIFKPQTPLTQRLYDRSHALLDEKFEQLKRHPARHPKDAVGKVLPDGSVSEYPLHYVELGPDIFTQCTFEYRDHIIQFDLEPLHVFHYDLQIEGFGKSKSDFIKYHLPTFPYDKAP